MKNQWARILIAGIGIEILYLAFYMIVLSSLGIGVYSALGILSLFAFLFIGGYWAALRTKSKTKAALNGALVGVVGIIFWVLYAILVITLGNGERPESATLPMVLFSNFIKIPGGALGGYTALKLKNQKV